MLRVCVVYFVYAATRPLPFHEPTFFENPLYRSSSSCSPSFAFFLEALFVEAKSEEKKRFFFFFLLRRQQQQQQLTHNILSINKNEWCVFFLPSLAAASTLSTAVWVKGANFIWVCVCAKDRVVNRFQG